MIRAVVLTQKYIASVLCAIAWHSVQFTSTEKTSDIGVTIQTNAEPVNWYFDIVVLYTMICMKFIFYVTNSTNKKICWVKHYSKGDRAWGTSRERPKVESKHNTSRATPSCPIVTLSLITICCGYVSTCTTYRGPTSLLFLKRLIETPVSNHIYIRHGQLPEHDVNTPYCIF